MNRLTYFLTFVLMVSSISFAQHDSTERCGTSIIMEEALKNPEKKQVLDQLELFTQEFISNTDSRSAEGPYIIPVVIHVIHNYQEENVSYEQVDNVINRLNEDFQGLNEDLSNVIDSFSDIIGFPNMEFRLATKDPDGNCTYGVNRVASPWTENSGTKVMPLSNWDDKKYVNIYVVRSFDENMSSAAAYATKPGSGSEEYGDYIFCRYDYFGDWNVNNDSGPTGSNWSRHTIPHEMGHFFNLDHPWGGSNSPAEEDNCLIDDGVEDTPETIGIDGNCPLDQITCDGLLDNVQNIMDYSNCAFMFTQGQSDRMVAAANSIAGNRWYLWQESNLIETGTDDLTFFGTPHADCSPAPDFNSNSDLGCAGAEISFENYTYNFRTENIQYNWEVINNGVVVNSSTENNPTFEFNNPGSFDIRLTACNGPNCQSKTMEGYVTILSQTTVDAISGLNQSFESESFPIIDSEIWWSGQDNNEQHWERTTIASSNGEASFRIKSQSYGYDRTAHSFSTPELNMSEFETSQDDQLNICFDIAYAKRLPYQAVEFDETGVVMDMFSIHNDALIVSYKSCDNPIWSERPRLSTRPGKDGLFGNQQKLLFTTDKVYFNAFVPSDDDWKQFCVPIQQLAGEENAIIKFEFIGTGEDQFSSHWVDDGISTQGELITASTIGGNWLYLDNIKVGRYSEIVDTSMSRNQTLENLTIAPNPSLFSDGASIYFDVSVDQELSFTLMNFVGNSILTTSRFVTSGHHRLSLSDLFNIPKKGSYILSVVSDDSKLAEVILIR